MDHPDLRDLRGRQVKFYPYRSASVRERFLTLSRKHTRELEADLAKMAGVSVDNHTAYGVTDFDNKTVFVQFHDDYTFFGTAIEERRW